MKALLSTSLFVFLASIVSVLAAEPVDLNKVARVRITKIDEGGVQPLFYSPVGAGAVQPDSNGMVQPLATVDIGKIINIGKQFWQLAKDNKSTGKYTPGDVGHALPKGVNSAMELASWKGPRYETYEALYENMVGYDLARMVYRVYFSFGGAYKGKGRYLTNVAVEALEVEAAIGYKFNATARTYPPMNVGTDKDPQAAMQLTVSWSLDGPTDYEEGSASFLVRGDGWLTDLNENKEYPPSGT